MKPSPQFKATPSSTLVPTTPVSSTGRAWKVSSTLSFVQLDVVTLANPRARFLKLQHGDSPGATDGKKKQATREKKREHTIQRLRQTMDGNSNFALQDYTEMTTLLLFKKIILKNAELAHLFLYSFHLYHLYASSVST